MPDPLALLRRYRLCDQVDHPLARWTFKRACERGEFDVVAAYAALGLDIDEALFWAIRLRDVELFEVLYELGADLGACENPRSGLYEVASEVDDPAILARLGELGVGPRPRTSPLDALPAEVLAAISRDDHAAIRRAIAAGVDLSGLGEEPVVLLAVERGQPVEARIETLELLADAGVALAGQVALVCDAVLGEQWALARALIELSVQRLAEVDLDGFDEAGRSVLHYLCDGACYVEPERSAAVRGELVAYLLDHGAGTGSTDCLDHSPWDLAYVSNSTACVEALEVAFERTLIDALVEAGHPPDARMFDARTCVYLAARTTRESLRHWARRGELEVVQALFDGGFELESEPAWANCSALELAVERHDAGMVALLLEHGADPNHRSRWHGTVLSRALEGPLEIVEALLDAGADPNLVGAFGESAVSVAAETDVDLLAGIVAAGGELDAAWAVASPLAAAIEYANLEAFAWLLERGIDANEPLDGGGRVILLPIRNGWRRCVARLLDAGADPNVETRGRSRTTALILAVQRGAPEIVRLLLDAGASVERVDARGYTAADHAACRPALSSLICGGAAPLFRPPLGELSPLVTAIHRGDHDAFVAALADAGADLDRPNPRGDTPLLLAAAHGCQAMVEALLDAGADLTRRNIWGEDARFLAWRADAEALGRALDERGLELGTAAYRAATSRHMRVYEALRAGDILGLAALLDELVVDVNLPSRRNKTLLELAIDWGDVEMAKMLVAKGAILGLDPET